MIKAKILFFLFSTCIFFAFFPLQRSFASDSFHRSSADRIVILDLKHKEAGGIGYDKGYTTIQAFTAIRSSDLYVVLFDLRAHQFNDGKLAGNIGLGLRKQIGVKERVIGGNIYYDVREIRQNSFQQIGIGLEYLSKPIDLRVNGYFPVGEDRHVVSYHFQKMQNHFFYGLEHFKVALKGCDIEAGKSLGSWKNAHFYGAFGFYYFQRGQCSTDLGGKVSLKADLGKYFSLEFFTSYDKLYHTKVQGQISFHFPLVEIQDKTIQVAKGILPLDSNFFARPPRRNDMIVLCDGYREMLAQVWPIDGFLRIRFFDTKFSHDTFGDQFIPISEETQRTIEKVLEEKTTSYTEKEMPLSPEDPEETLQPHEEQQGKEEEGEGIGYFIRFLEFIYQHIKDK
jgi:hypothetical protein